MPFTPIDQATWPRQQYFYYFTKMQPMGFTLSAKLDITNTYQALHHMGAHFFPSYLYATSRTLSAMAEFRIGRRDGQLGYYDVLNPAYSVMRADHSIASCWSKYSPDFATFAARVQADQAAARATSGPLGKPSQPANSFEAGMLPWLHFDSYTPQVFGGLQTFAPVLQAGRYQDVGGRVLLPLSVTAHHAVVDGYHVSRLFDALQQAFTTPDWLA